MCSTLKQIIVYQGDLNRQGLNISTLWLDTSHKDLVFKYRCNSFGIWTSANHTDKFAQKRRNSTKQNRVPFTQTLSCTIRPLI